ncbi:transmembrane protein, variant [Capsaspora owczarzaki ATCC 30864]|uniref:Alkylglycerol monooxygenase n=1 Tax=Capsaspora owczarzaki (strain ATCC 30864) TaxID=595528 RepID=A0A0D2X097_CAPO3|nr:transmembrane protein, variant [Capsaspora owczarzaki ATCC 30864]
MGRGGTHRTQQKKKSSKTNKKKTWKRTILSRLVLDLWPIWTCGRHAHIKNLSQIALQPEINLLWAGHEYNLTTALRQGVLQGPTVFCFYLPLALVLPPPILAVHKHFNTLYQFWIHTQMIKSLGPLEWILNTPSHHAVHHGRNRYCIDKNYGGTLIIWDRLFGTFQAEADPIVFGVTHPLSTWDPVYTQFAHIRHIFRKAWAIQGWRNKLAVFFYGPGWDIGKARTGDLNDIPDVRAPWPKYDRSLSAVMAGYVFVHFLLLVVALQLLTSNLLAYPVMVLLALYMLTTLSSFGALLDHKPMANGLELGRILSVLVLDTAIRGYLGRDTHAFFWLPRAQVSDTVQFQLEVLWTILLASAGFMVIQMAVSPSNASLTDKQQAKLREEAPVPSTSSTTPTPLGARRSQRTLSSR